MADYNGKFKKKRLDIHFTEEEFEFLSEIADKKGMSKTEVMRQLFLLHGEQFLNQSLIKSYATAA